MRISLNLSLVDKIRQAFPLPAIAVREEKVDESLPRGISHSIYAGEVHHYGDPVMPEQIDRFLGKRKSDGFKSITTAVLEKGEN